MKMYHVSPLENKESILKDGLIINKNPISDIADKFIYLTDDYDDLIGSGVYPEIYDFDEIVVFEVEVDESELIPDPEFDGEDGFSMMYPKNIPSSSIKVHKILTRHPNVGTRVVYK